MIAYYGADRDFVDTYSFANDEVVLFPDKVGARESIIDKISGEYDSHGYYIVQVEIKGFLFNPFNRTHLSQLYNKLPKKFKHSLLGDTNKDIIIACLKANWGDDDNNTEASLENSDNVLYFEDETIKTILKHLGYNGIIMMEDNLGLYLVFKPNDNTEVINISL